MIGVEYVSVRDPMPHSLCNNVALTLTSKVVLILANCPTAAGYSAYGGRCLKVYLDNVNYTTAQGRCSADGGQTCTTTSPWPLTENPFVCC